VAAGPAQAEVALPWILAVLLRGLRAILWFAGAGAAISLVVALLQPRRYTSSFSFFPQSVSGQGTDGLAALAGQVGISLGAVGGSSQPPQLFAALIETREVLGPVAVDTVATTGSGTERVPLAEFLGISGADGPPPVVLERTIEALRRDVISTGVAARTTGVVSVRVRTKSPQVSLAIAARLLDGLNRYNRQIRQAQAAEERRFIEGRLGAARAALRAAEDALQRFLQTNRQFAGSPQLSLQRGRLERELALRQQVVTGLTQQSEDARIREVRDTPIITVIEAPLNEERSLAVIADVKKLIPNKPIRYLVSTHHHWDHLGGVRAYVQQEGVTIVLQQNNHAYYAEVLTVRPWTLKPDRLALAPPEEVAEGYTFETVGQKYVLTDGTKVMEVYNVQGLAHAQGMLMAYLPKEKLLIEADIVDTDRPLPATPTRDMTSFYKAAQMLKLDASQIVPIHGKPIPWNDFVKVAGGSKSN